MDNGPNGTRGPRVQPRVTGERSDACDAVTIRRHKMAVLTAWACPLKVGLAASGRVQVGVLYLKSVNTQ